jgi:hypothetical protein
MVDFLGFIMAEILDNVFQKAIEEQGAMEDQKRKQAPAIDSVIAAGPDLIQLPKLGKKDAATDEGANAFQEVTAPEFNLHPTKSSENDTVTDATAKVANERAPDEGVVAVKAAGVKAAAPELNSNPKKLCENDAVTDATAKVASERAPDEGADAVKATAP